MPELGRLRFSTSTSELHDISFVIPIYTNIEKLKRKFPTIRLDLNQTHKLN